MVLAWLPLAWLLLPAAPASAVIIDTGTGTGNASAPADDPGWDNVGRHVNSSNTGVYLGNGWVLTANHVGPGPIDFGGTIYYDVTGSKVRFQNPAPDTTWADLIVYKVKLSPPLPALAIRSTVPPVNTPVVMIGHGYDRGAAYSYAGHAGWEWATPHSMRWGTNRVTANSIIANNNYSFYVTFDDIPSPPAGEHECQAVGGDSGGGVFIKNGGSWELAGTMWGQVAWNGQASATSVHGNLAYSLDLSVYRSDILAVIQQPACNDGLDEDGDGAVDYPADPGCDDALDNDEHSPSLPCDDGIDNDGDKAIDFPFDDGCRNLLDPTETVDIGVPMLGALSLSLLAGLLAVAGYLAARAHSSSKCTL